MKLSSARVLLFCVLVFLCSGRPVAAFTETERLASWAKVWGFLKYYHPQVATGSLDWDQQMIKLLPEVQRAATSVELSLIYQNLVKKLGPVAPCSNCASEQNIPAWYRRSLDLSFLTDSSMFSLPLQQDLLYIKHHRNQQPNYYAKYKMPGTADFSNEKTYEEMMVPTEEYRLLTLFRYWNAIQYFFPYKYAIGENWETVLERLIPVFREAKDLKTYNAALQQMVASIHDSHSVLDIDSPVALQAHKKASETWYFSPYMVSFVGRVPVVTGIRNDSLAAVGPLRVGDIITHVNQVPIDSIIEQKRKFTPASNEATLLRSLRYNLLNGTTSVSDVTFLRDGKTVTEKLLRFTSKELGPLAEKPDSTVSWQKDGVGYVHMGNLKMTQVDSVMRRLWSNKAIIFDLRYYPQGTAFRIATFLTAKPVIRTLVTGPDFTFPGVFQELKPRMIEPAKGKPYKGQVIMLINEQTQSQGEFSAMLMKASPNATLVGSHTAGADGNVTYVPLPGGLKAVFTGLGIYYPDRTETQRIGILPNVEVKRTIQGIKDQCDEVLEKALQLAQAKR